MPSPEILSEKAAMTNKRFTVRSQHLRFTQVILQDQTDIRNELVQQREWLLHPSEKLELQGNLFVLENVITGDGQVLVKLAPLPHARPVTSPVDITVIPRKDSGFDFILHGDPTGGGNSSTEFAVLNYSGGRFGRVRALQSFQRSQVPAAAKCHPPRFLSNTWGDRSRDSRICQSFMELEIEAGARLGVEVIQIDDGWQKGISRNSARAAGKGVWEGFWRVQPDFWEPDPVKFPLGLQPLTRQAARHGMALGLWYAADSVDDFANWEKDAACLTAYHSNLGIRHFKIDSIHAPNARAHANLRLLFDKVRDSTGGNVVFDLDVTAQRRPGYFGLLGTGPLFVENRYSDGHSYWPHQTLRNLWQLSGWVDPGRLRMEFLNHSRNIEKYPDDPLAPSCYTPDALFATVFFSNPLGWFEISNLPASYLERVTPLVRIWKELRQELFSGTILPLGQAPDGVSWTGFASVQDGGGGAIVLIYRELNPNSFCRLDIPGFVGHGQVRCEVLAGRGQAIWQDEALQVTVTSSLSWVLIRLNI